MILDKFLENLKKQRWSTLFLELLVVVVGIFLGLQADSWYQSRSDQKELSTYLQALADELGSSAWVRGNYVRYHERIIEGLEKVLDRVDNGAPLSADEQLAFTALTNLADPPTSPQRSAVLSAMQAEGMLRLIDEPDLRQVLGEILGAVDSEYAEYDRYVGAISAPEFAAEIVHYGIDADGDVAIIDVDWNAAALDPSFRLRVLQGLRTYRLLRRLHRSTLVINEQALEMLAQRGFEPSGSWLQENQERLNNN